jgi:hypothetical protein
VSAVTTAVVQASRVTVRSLLTIDALLCAVSGVIALAAAGPVADLLGVDARGWVSGVGVFLLFYAADLWFLSRSRETVARRGAAVTAIGDALWVAGTAVLIAAGVLSAAGVTTMVIVALPVGALGVAKAVALRG